MTKAGIGRALAPSEKVHFGKEAYIGYTVRTSGRLDPDALTTAYDAVCDAYPQFSARLDIGDAGPIFVEADVRPEVTFREGDLDAPLAGLDLDQSKTLTALNVACKGDEASVCLAIHHSIADAHNAIDVVTTLWSCYTDVVNGVPVDLPSHPYPRSLEDLLAERGIHPHAAPAPTPPSPSPTPTPNPPVSLPDPVVRYVYQHRLSAAQTAAIAELGHRERLTINSLLSGAILLAEAEIRDLPLTELVYRYSVNLRSRLTPPVGSTEGTNVLGGVGFKVSPDLAPDAVTIGRAIGAQLQAGLADGSIQRSLLDMLSRPLPGGKPWDPSLALKVVSVMNWGQVPMMRTPDGLRLTNFHSASRMREASALGGYVVNTFDGRIGIDLGWPEGDPQLSKRVECLRAQLSRLTPDL